MTSDELKQLIRDELRGIDDTETCDEHGWWETSAGAEFGRKKLEAVLALIDRAGFDER
jgi:hypothetical protein